MGTEFVHASTGMPHSRASARATSASLAAWAVPDSVSDAFRAAVRTAAQCSRPHRRTRIWRARFARVANRVHAARFCHRRVGRSRRVGAGLAEAPAAWAGGGYAAAGVWGCRRVVRGGSAPGPFERPAGSSIAVGVLSLRGRLSFRDAGAPRRRSRSAGYPRPTHWCGRSPRVAASPDRRTRNSDR